MHLWVDIVYTIYYNVRVNRHKTMSKRTIFADGCDIAVYNSQGHILMEYNDVSREIAVDTLNTLHQLILNEDNRRRAKEEVNDTDLFDRLDEEFNIRAKKLLPKPIR